MKNIIYAISWLLFCSILSVIFFIIGKKNSDDKKKKPLGPTTIFVYVWNGIYKTIKAHHRRREAHAAKFDDAPHRLSPEMMEALEKAPSYTMDELEELTTPTKKQKSVIIITD